MKVIQNAAEMRTWAEEKRCTGSRIGFVPTMGYLHEGHLSLIDIARSHSDAVAVSIFVNPAQFGPNEDFESYPRDEQRDLKLCEEKGVDAVYYPSREAMYPEGYATYVEVEKLEKHLCGASRPGHFRGVCTVVTKLFHTVMPHVAVFGQKDAQQLRILERMTEDLEFGIGILPGPTMRNDDGLAKSSRNVRLKAEHRGQAPVLYKALQEAETLFQKGETDSQKLLEHMREVIHRNAPDGEIDYLQAVAWSDLQPIHRVEQRTLLALAVYFGNVRLIDNILLEPDHL